MPTGYTAKIVDGQSFPDYVKTCLRAMGVCVSMRDLPMDTPIPEKFEPSPYHKDCIESINQEIQKFATMTNAEIAAYNIEQYELQLEHAKSTYEKNCVDKQKCVDMLNKVRQWIPPSPADLYMEFKKFMIEQLNTTIQHDYGFIDTYWKERIFECENNKNKDFYKEEVQRLGDELKYHITAFEKECNRCAKNTEYIQAILQSLENS